MCTQRRKKGLEDEFQHNDKMNALLMPWVIPKQQAVWCGRCLWIFQDKHIKVLSCYSINSYFSKLVPPLKLKVPPFTSSFKLSIHTGSFRFMFHTWTLQNFHIQTLGSSKITFCYKMLITRGSEGLWEFLKFFTHKFNSGTKPWHKQ